MLVESTTGELDADKFFCLLCDVVGNTFRRSHPEAFESCGFTTQQAKVSQRVLQSLEWVSLPHVDSELPTLEELQHIWPGGKKREIPIFSLFRFFLPRKTARSKARHHDVEDEEKRRSPTPPLKKRLRSASRLKLLKAEHKETKTTPRSSRAATWIPAPPLPPVASATPSPLPAVRRIPIGRPLLPRRLRSLEAEHLREAET